MEREIMQTLATLARLLVIIAVVVITVISLVIHKQRKDAGDPRYQRKSLKERMMMFFTDGKIK